MLALKLSTIVYFTLFITCQAQGQQLPSTAECQSCVGGLPQGCSELMATNPQEAGSKCLCIPAFVNNFSNCGVCSQQTSGITPIVIPTDSDKQQYIQDCANDGLPIVLDPSSSSTLPTSSIVSSPAPSSTTTTSSSSKPLPTTTGNNGRSLSGVNELCLILSVTTLMALFFI